MEKRLRDLEDKTASNATAIAHVRRAQAELGTQRVKLQELLVRMVSCETRISGKLDQSPATIAAETAPDASPAPDHTTRPKQSEDHVARLDIDIGKIVADNHDLWADRHALDLRLTDVEQRLEALEAASGSTRKQQRPPPVKEESRLDGSPPRAAPGMVTTPLSAVRSTLPARPPAKDFVPGQPWSTGEGSSQPQGRAVKW
jgi:chromosome segregation ATPase